MRDHLDTASRTESVQEPLGVEVHRDAEPAGSIEARASEALRHYRQSTRHFLEKHLPVSLEALDRRAELLHSALGAKTRLDIGFVGESQVGKSTLLNALLEEYALPSGGIGPLTAQAIHVHHSTQPFFRVKYHSKKTLNETRFAIESYLAALKKTEAPQLIEESDSGRELLNALTSDDDSKESRRTGDELLDTIGRVFGIPPETEEHASVTTSALRLALGQDTIRTVQFDKQTNDRIRAVSELLDTDCTIREDGDRQPFADALRLRAAGWHSPLVSELELHLNSSLLETLNLVDLPGVGTINDPSQLATRDFVKHGDALVLVVRNNGVTKAIVQLLEKAEFITRWIWASDLDHPPIHAMVVVTHLDDVARGRYSEEKQRTRDSGERPTSRDLIFAGIAKEMQDKILHDMKAELLRSPSFDELEEDQRTKRTQIVEAMCSDLQVHCVAAPDALELILGDDDDAFLRDLGTTGIPRLRMALTHMAQEYLKRRHDRLHYSFEQFSILLRRQVQLAVRRYNEAPEVGLVKRFREVADPMLAILKKEMQGLHGRCMSKLSEGIPDKIALLCAKAEKTASQKLAAMRRDAANLYYASLNAALRRSGRWDNKGIDYPGLLTRTFVEKIAGDWEVTIVAPVRSTLTELVEQDAALVDQVVSVAKTIDAILVQSADVEAFLESMRDAARSGSSWSDEQLQELRASAETHLSDAVLEPIAAACEVAIAEGKNRGAGAKQRILEVFEAAGIEALEQATKVAEQLLRQLYSKMFAKLHAGYLLEFRDPVGKIYDAITEGGGKREHVIQEQLVREVESYASRFASEVEPVLA